MTIEPGFKDDNFNASKYDFTWSLDYVDFENNEISFQLDFAEPL
jgi:hypothetical protein